MEALSINYRGFAITHRELQSADIFHVEGDDWHSDMSTLQNTMVYIDRMLKQKFERADVILPRYGYRKENGEIIEGTLTSITDDGSVWVTYKKPTSFSTRAKINDGVYFDTPENRKIIEELFDLIKKKAIQDAKIEQEIADLKLKMSSPIPAKKKGAE